MIIITEDWKPETKRQCLHSTATLTGVDWIYEDWINKLCQALSGNTSSVKIFLEVNMLSESNEKR